MAKFQNKYRIGSTRLKNWDYGSDAPYFVTICIQNHEKLFGQIEDGTMSPNEIGKIVNDIWVQIPEKFAYAELGEYVVMPNHFHGTVFIDKNKNDGKIFKYENMQQGGFAGMKNPMLNENLSRIIRWFKGRATFEIRKINPNFAWQRRFWDNVVRSEEAFINIENYILNNPKNWDEDKFYS